MNQNEKIVKEYFENQGYYVKFNPLHLPDFSIIKDDKIKFFVEVTSSSYLLSPNQEIKFAELDLPIYIYFIKNNKIVGHKLFEPLQILPSSQKQLNLTFEDEEFEFLKEKKKDKTWREFILKLVDYSKREK